MPDITQRDFVEAKNRASKRGLAQPQLAVHFAGLISSDPPFVIGLVRALVQIDSVVRTIPQDTLVRILTTGISAGLQIGLELPKPS